MRSIYIVGGGNSLKGFNFNKLSNKDTIVVNKAISYVPNPTYFVTMDFTFLAKMKNKDVPLSNATKIFIANFAKPYLKENNGKIVDTRFDLVYKLEDFDMIIKSHKETGMGLTFNDFRTGNNSGYCALQLAILLGYERIYLLGMDLTIDKETHFHGGYGESKEKFKQRLEGYYNNFKIGLNQINKNQNVKIYSCSKISKLNNLIPYHEL